VKRVWRIVCWLVLTVIAGNPARTAQSDWQHYEAKAKFLANAPAFVEWPTDTFKGANDPLLICVHGDFSFGTTLAEMTRGEKVRGHRLEVRWVKNERDLPGCQVIFVSHSAGKRYEKTLESLKASLSLTIGEEPEFLKAGGMVILQTVPSGLLFDVNIDAVHNGHLKLSSQLLSLARRVVRQTEAASI
jgi:hypothetical protein